MINIFKIKNKPFSLVKDAGYNNKHPFYDLAKDYDNYGFIDKKLGMELYNLFEEGYTIGIHRTGYSKIGSVTEHDIPDTLKDIFHNGLKNNGDSMQGVVSDSNYISSTDTITFFKDFSIFLGQVKAAYDYKTSDGVIIVKIPSSYISETNEIAKPIYFMDGNLPRLLPEYIYGYVPVDKNGCCGDIIRNKNYKDHHDYQNNGLYYDSETGMSNNFVA